MDIFLDLQYGKFKIGSFNRSLDVSLKIFKSGMCSHCEPALYKLQNPPKLNIKKVSIMVIVVQFRNLT